MTPVRAANWLILIAVAATIGALTALAMLPGCTPAQQQTLSNTTQATLTGVKIAACVQSVLAEQEQAQALAHRLAETAAELEAERIRSAVSEPSDSVKAEVDKVLRDGGTAQ